MTETKKNTTAKRGPYRSQLVSRGDVSHARASDEVQEIVTDETTEAADQKELEALGTILKGEAPADRIRLLRLLLRQERLNYAATSSRVDNPDDILVKDWRTGVYPYKNRLNRKTYEKEKFALQVELLKLQAWVKETGQRVIILFEGRDAAGKGGTIKRFMEPLVSPSISDQYARQRARPVKRKLRNHFHGGNERSRHGPQVPDAKPLVEREAEAHGHFAGANLL